MFISRSAQLPVRNRCKHCVRCKWCHIRHLKPDCFCFKDGPLERWFCDSKCAAKFVKYRHEIGVSHVLKMDYLQRKLYLDNKTLDEYIETEWKLNKHVLNVKK